MLSGNRSRAGGIQHFEADRGRTIGGTMRAMGRMDRDGLRALEGARVSVALVDGSRIDDAEVVSAGRPGVSSLWLFVNGCDVFVPLSQVAACWEATAPRPSRPHAIAA